MVELQYGCCEERNCRILSKPTQIIDRKTALVEFIFPPSAADVSFNYLAGQVADAAYGNDPSNAGIEPFTGTSPGAMLGTITSGIDATITNGEGITSVTYTIREVTCGTTNPQGALVYETTLPLTTGQQPENFFFADIDSDVWDPVVQDWRPYFTVPENIDNKCFSIVVTVSNECGDISETGFFTINQNCGNCYVAPETGTIQQEREGSEIEEEINLLNEELSIAPNPTSNFVTVRYPQKSLGQMEVFNANGQIVLIEKLNEDGQSVLNLSHLSSGIYYLRVDTKTAQTYKKLIKI